MGEPVASAVPAGAGRSRPADPQVSQAGWADQMTRKLLVIIALGAALAIIGAGTATSITVGGVQVNSPTDGVLPQCANLNDDDGDGLVDLGDPGCSSALDTSEYNAPTSGGSGGGTTTSGGSGSTGSGTSSTTTTSGGGSTGGGSTGGGK